MTDVVADMTILQAGTGYDYTDFTITGTGFTITGQPDQA